VAAQGPGRPPVQFAICDSPPALHRLGTTMGRAVLVTVLLCYVKSHVNMGNEMIGRPHRPRCVGGEVVPSRGFLIWGEKGLRPSQPAKDVANAAGPRHLEGFLEPGLLEQQIGHQHAQAGVLALEFIDQGLGVGFQLCRLGV
jgi:hypothetical protein